MSQCIAALLEDQGAFKQLLAVWERLNIAYKARFEYLRALQRFIDARTDLDSVVSLLWAETSRLQAVYEKCSELYNLMNGLKTKHSTAVLLHKIGEFRRKNQNSDVYWLGLPIYE